MSNDESVTKRLNDTPKAHKANYAQAMRGQSRTAGVKAFCLECVAWEKEEIRQCASKACPLYPYRPYK